MELRVERGCGFREEGGIYIETKLSPFGTPLSRFLMDPPIEIDPTAYGLGDRGVQIIERVDEFGEGSGIFDVWDIIGGDAYPNLADFIGELAKFGLSRRIARTAQFDLLTEKSKIVLVHKRAVIKNYTALRAAVALDIDAPLFCPTLNMHHANAIPEPVNESCLGLAYEDLDPATCELVLDPAVPARTATRSMPSFDYTAKRRPDGFKPDYAHGIFSILPISQITVIKSPGDPDTYHAAMNAALNASLPIISEES